MQCNHKLKVNLVSGKSKKVGSMDKYEYLGILGEGSYGKVMKYRHKESGQLVAIKKFIETEEDLIARKMALREIRMLKRLQHDNLVSMLEVFRRKKRFHLVFEYMAQTLLNKIEKCGGLSEELTRKYTFQIVRALDFCHANNIVHRDLKPENVLVSDNDVVKVCDFGFARFVTISQDPFTDYVATRWYRAPELLVGDSQYGRAVDIWALGTLVIEMLTAEPMFAGDSDIDQLHKITKLLGPMTDKQLHCLSRGASGTDLEALKVNDMHPGGYVMLQEVYPFLKNKTVDFVSSCLRMNPQERPKSDQLLTVAYFTWDNFPQKFLPELAQKLAVEAERRPKIQKMPCPPTNKEDGSSPRLTGPIKQEWKLEPQAGNDDVVHIMSLGGRSSGSLGSLLHPKMETEEDHGLPLPPTLEEKEIEEKPSLLRSSKLMARYRKDMMPQTLRIVPVNGRLVFDDSEKYCRDYTYPKKPTSKDFCLPELPGTDAKKRKQEPFLAGDSCVCIPLVTRTTTVCPFCNPLPQL
uniref:cyclin-dependent kinase n=1 Tax=Lygus hesperus TaxID=30085 RepID=A0A0A9YCV2_LYGHE